MVSAAGPVSSASSVACGASWSQDMVNSLMHTESVELGGNSPAGTLSGWFMAEKTGRTGRQLAGKAYTPHTQPSHTSAICQVKRPEV